MERYYCLEVNGDYSFTNCQWHGCRHSSNGSCIFLVNSSSSLSIERSSFTNCNIQAGNGGAIYLYQINKAHIYDSSFLRCNILSYSHPEHGGGFVSLELVSQEVLIKSSCFCDSSVPSDAGGVDIWYCSCTTGNTQTFQDCRFVKCKGTGSEGGGIMAWLNRYNVEISNTLFTDSSNRDGGGFKMYVTETFSSPFITFCFFHRNTATNGKDIFFYNCGTNPISHSFTTTNEPYTVIPERWNTQTKQDNWLPHVSDGVSHSN